MIKNKKAQSTQNLTLVIVLSFAVIILIATFLYVFGIVDGALAGDISAGSVNLSNESANTIGKLNTAFLNTADLIGIMFIFGLVIAMVINGFLNRNSNPKLFFILDFLMIIFAYILAVYISNSYESILGSLPFAGLIASNLSTSSSIILYLPLITVVTGFLIMLVTYAGIPKSREEEVAGF